MAHKWACGILAFALCLSIASARAACSRNEYGVFEDIACASEARAFTDGKLNELYNQLLASLEPDSKEKLKATQRAWLKYLEANVAFVYAVEGNGSAGRLVVANEREQQTQARIKELSNWLPKRNQ